MQINGRGLESRERHTHTLPPPNDFHQFEEKHLHMNQYFPIKILYYSLNWLYFQLCSWPKLSIFLTFGNNSGLLSQTWKKVDAATTWRQKEKKSVRELLVTSRKNTPDKHLVWCFWQFEDIPDKANLPHKHQRMANLISTHHPPSLEVCWPEAW
jgi:hypothetical protein